jgi:site-specific DNA recombinase
MTDSTPLTTRPGRNPATASCAIRFASWGRVSTEDRQDPESSRAWQRARATSLIEPHGGQIVAEFFDVDKSRSIPPQRRPEAARLLTALADPRRGFDAVVVGEPQRAFYGNQFGNTFPLFTHFGVPLWVPEVGGPIDPDNEAHDLIMSVFGGVSKGERNRIRVRVRAAMATQAQMEGRYLGGRPPYGYRLVDVGPHPNPAKAADGKRLRALAIDEPAAAVVRRIFAEFLAGCGLYAIAEHLTRDGIPSPSAYDPGRNRHRCGIAWSKGAIRAILMNPRYTGRQVWNRQRKDEVLIDIHDVALGHTTKMRWNDQGDWIFSEDLTHPPVISQETFAQGQQMLALRRRSSGPRERLRTRHVYALGGRFICGLCDRKMQAHWANGLAYYRCRFPAEYAIANKSSHPRNVFVREQEVLPALDAWLATEFAPHRIEATIEEMTAAQDSPGSERQAIADACEAIRDCEAKMVRYRAAIDASGDIEEITQWINTAKAERLQAEAALRGSTAPARMTGEEIKTIVERFASIAAVIRAADPADKAEIYRGLNLMLTYQPEAQTVRAQVHLSADSHGVMVRVRGGT